MADHPSFEKQQSPLTEREVARRFVPFLKDFYKNRYQSDPSTIQVTLDNVSTEGWVADGKLTFRKPDGSAFVCTYEATSRDKSEEVKFKRNHHELTWDCVASGTLVAAIAYVWCFKVHLLWLIHLKGPGNVGFLFAVFSVVFLGCYFTLQGWRKYRYIFAIQQFQQYFADEQWVALAEDVFPSPHDPYYLELRSQCVYQGIGLAIVPMEGHVRKVFDPSRLGLYGKDRKMAHWVTQTPLYRNLREQAVATASRIPKVPNGFLALWNRLFRPIQYRVLHPIIQRIGKLRGATNMQLLKGSRAQKWVVLAVMLVIVLLFRKIASFTADNVADLDRLQHWNGGQNPEDEQGFVIDGAAIPYDATPPGVPKQYPVASNHEEQYRDDREEGKMPLPVLKKIPAKKYNSAPTVAPLDPCNQLKKDGWIVQESSFSSKVVAQERLKILKKVGVQCQFAPRKCLPNNSNTGYLVWLGPVFSTESAARQSAETYTKTLVGAKLLKDKLFVRRLQ